MTATRRTKSQIMKELMEYKQFQNREEFAKFLRIKPARLGNWFCEKINSKIDIDIIARAMPEVSAEFLLRGEGPLLKTESSVYLNNSTNTVNSTVVPDKALAMIETELEYLRKQNDNIQQIIVEKDKIIQQMTEAIIKAKL